MVYGEGPTFDGMGEVLPGNLTRIIRQYKNRIRELEAEVELLKAQLRCADEGLRKSPSHKLWTRAEKLEAENAALKAKLIEGQRLISIVQSQCPDKNEWLADAEKWLE